uniref:laminin subunit alpha-5 isoform X4 n=1 Tax=Ciona intestinalis TaxID=7719 RepID=UPI000EF4AEA7|nr:laminin subunit alpha-5 isoform X4 [Ciona intestinalis]|eukprot:XP_026696566.1 laminin subunit alpha-5 isoform X4 [Ciona intestinalis]
MLRLAIAFGLVCVTLGQIRDDIFVVTEQNVLSPPYFNIASGKKIGATATCGDENEELFCKLTGGTNFEFSNSLHQGQVCDICDATNPEKAHPVKNAIDGTEKWWQSPPLSRGSQFNKVNLTIHLGQVFHVAYVLIKFANSPRAGTWVLERSSDHGETFQPWQYFANTNSDCFNLFGMDSLEEITRDDSVVCTSDYSSVVPLENGEVIVSMIKGRPGANNFSYATVLQEWSKATDVRLRFLRTKTLLGHLMAISEQDPTVTRRYYYSIKDISIGGRCVCNGHADTCLPDKNDQYKLKCECRHNTCGDSCERCCEGYVQKAWRAAVPESTNQCEACNCHGHSSECQYDEDVARRRLSIDLAGNYEGGGVCLNCLHNTAGINCEQCASGYWRPSSVDPRSIDGCRPCDCDSTYTVGSCEPNTGRCYCKVQYAGDRCDRCAPGYYDFPECRLPGQACDCYYNGTLNDVCLPLGDACPCKYNFAGKYCDECAPGFFNFPQCDVCECTGEGVASDVCDPYSGACPCADGFAGPSCTECADGYFNYPLCQRCPCSDVGTTGNVCDPITGQCICGDKYAGQSCDDCRSGFFGFPVCQECQCTEPGSLDNTCDTRSGRCHCKSNYRGESCEECAPEYYGYPNCVSCDCDLRGSQRTTCDQTNGQCLCRPNVGGRACDHCTPDYFNFPRCEECSCDARGIESVVPGVCLAFTTGQCECKPNVVGKNCDMCKPLHYDIDQGCVSCNCFLQGTLDGVGNCDSDDGQCFCKPYTCTQRCSQCVDGFYGLEDLNYLGCTSCQCDIGGAMTASCDKNTGQCRCRTGVAGRRCNRAADGSYYPTLYQYQYELEYGKTPENLPVRYGFSETDFPGFSMSGYAKFSVVQQSVVVPVNVHNSGLYRIMFRYVNTGSQSVSANVTANSNSPSDGPGQSQKVTFEVTSEPRMVTVSTPFVLNKGVWTIVIEAQPGLLIDYLVLLPSEYYEPGILQLTSTVPCIPSITSSDTECVMFTHPSLGGFTMVDVTNHAGSLRTDSPSTAHPEMLVLDGTSGVAEQQTYTVDIALPQAGKYVLVLEYASTQNQLQRSSVTVSDGAANDYSDVKFNVYACPYSFLCRQVALGVLDDVKVFELSLPTMRVTMTTEAGASFYIKSLTAIPYSEWTMELVEPKPLCITTTGPAFDQCVTSVYPVPLGSSKFNVPVPTTVDGDDEPAPPTLPDNINDESVQLVYLDGADVTGGGQTTLQIPMNLRPGRYVFLVHFYNPDHISFAPRVVIDGGIASTGDANITYCPSADGCRAVVTKDDGSVVVDITVPTTTFTITVPNGKAFWVQYVLAVPEADYNPKLLNLSPTDKSSDFIRKCGTDGQQSFYGTLENPSEFCQESIFSLTVNHNAGALPCNCSGAGTVGGGDAACEAYGGQCPCRPNVIGRQCERCKTGYFSFPNCQPCDCGGAMCDPVNGNCICPVNTIAPACDECQPLTHSFDPIQGCLECDCNADGVENVTDRGCDVADGQCNCKETVTGQRCDQCKPGYFGFPNCRKCQCDERGRASDGCNPITGQCLCKPNVAGLQCDRCKDGSFNLNGTNPNGCTECFCFGVSDSCTPTQYPATEIYDMTNWRMLYLQEPVPEVETSSDGQTLRVDVANNGGAQDPQSAKIYWAAPKTYLGEKVGSYGGDLRYIASYSFGGRGDADFGSVGSAQPAPLLAPVPDVILKGNNMVIGWVNEGGYENVNLKLSEHNFKHEQSNIQVTRAELMMVLSDLQSLHIRAAPEVGVSSVSLRDVVMTTTDYSLPLGSGATIPSVEECSCPPGYHGHSCEFCDAGYYRDQRGPYLGYCKQCDCYGHCVTCDEVGPISSKDCLHNTGGDNCDVCIDGYIGNATSGEIDACQPCPCPFPMEDGNFADTCEQLDGELVCYCQVGYTGARCELCASGYFGNPAVYGGSCQPCNCHGNLDPNLIMETCDPLTGECSECMFNTGGKYCERCADGYFGDAIIARNCTECACDACGTNVCDHMMGHCSCQPHVIGSLCDTCEPGFYNFDSCTGCQNCACAEGALNSVCDVNTGECQCAPNIVGARCDRCAPGFYDYSEMGCKPCNCRNNGPCNPVNGQCECPPGITGVQCDQCELARHILPPGARECERCGTCTDDLLDEVEPMTYQVNAAFSQLANISVGVHAYRKLQELQQLIENAANNSLIEEGFMTGTVRSANNLLGGGLAGLEEMVSGSGEDIDGSGMTRSAAGLNQPPSSSFNDIFLVISYGESAVSEMCNHTEVLLGKVTETENVTMNGLANAMALETVAGEFMADVADLKMKLNEEASGDADDYYQKLRDAEMILSRMQERDFVPMKSAADLELGLATDLFDRINTNFTVPATNASNKVDALGEELTTKRNKLKDLRSKLNDAILDVNDATTANAVNRKNLTEMTDSINSEWAMHEINSDSAMVEDLLTDAETLLNASVTSVNGPITNGIDELDQLHTGLTESIGRLQPFYDNLSTELESATVLANASIAKAAQLADDAAALSAIVETDSQPHRAANVYQEIYIAMTNAANAAEEALMEATKAENDVADKNLQAAAEAAEQRSSNLLSETQDLQQNDISNLQDNMMMTKDKLTEQEASVTSLNNQLDSLNAAIDALDRGTMDADIASTQDIAAEADRAADEATVQADILQDQIRNAPDPNTDLARELAVTEQLLTDLETSVPVLESTTQNTQAKVERLRGLESSLGLLQKIDDIKKKISLTRHVANGVKSSMQFTSVPEGQPVQYVQLRTPVTVQGLENNLIAEFYVNVDPEAADNSLMYIGDAARSDGDFGAVETVNGKVRYYFKVGNGFRQLESDVAINTGQWHKIIVRRIGNFGSLEVEYPSQEVGRGDGTPASSVASDYKEGRTDGQEQVANIHHSSMSFYMGGNPMASPPSQIQNHQVGSACIGEVKLNNETIGIWNFKAYEGPKPGQNCEDRPSSDVSSNPDNLLGVAGLGSNQVWRFSGYGSYVRIARSDISFLNNNAGVHFIGFKFETLQDNSLLFLVGQTTDQFIALEVVDGKLVMTWNYGFAGGPRNRTLHDVGDVTMHDRQLLVKTGVATTHRVTVVSVDLRLILQDTYDNGSPNILGDVWIGGMWNTNINPDFRSLLRNIDVSFRGCLRELNFNSRSFDIQNAIENMGVTRGCQKESVSDLRLAGGDFVKMPSSLPSIQNIDGNVVMRTGTPSGTILNFRDTETNEQLTLFLREGHVVLSDGVQEVESREFYANDQAHMINFKRTADGSMRLTLDNSDSRRYESPLALAETELSRRRRQNFGLEVEIINPQVYVYIGGAENMPMFNGCIKNPYIMRQGRTPYILTSALNCEASGTSCVGRPLFNACNVGRVITQEVMEIGDNLAALSSVSAHSSADELNGRAREDLTAHAQVNVIEVRVPVYNEGYESTCSLPYLPESRGYRYIGDGYSQYIVKRFNPLNWRFSLSLRTTRKRGLIFFMSDTRCNEHIAVYVKHGFIVFSVMFGNERTRLKSIQTYNDGMWHHVTFERKGNATQLMLDDSIEGQGTIFSNSLTFLSNKEFYIGGLEEVPKRFAVRHINRKNLADFTGCIKDVMANNVPIERSGTSSVVRSNVSPCYEGGSEPGMFYPHPNEGYSSAYMVGIANYTVATNIEVTLEIKPRAQSGVLFAVGGTTGSFFHLTLVDGQIVARVRQGGETLFTTYDPSQYSDNLCDGRWHVIRVIKAKNILALTVDDNLVTPIEEGLLENSNCDTNGELYVGGLPVGVHMDGMLTRSQYQGCIRKLRVDYFPINPSTSYSIYGDITTNNCPIQ